MLTATYVGDRTIQIEDAEPAAPSPGQVQIQVAYVGLCGTDLHVLEGHLDARVKPPTVIGHEMSGVIAAVGEHVHNWQVGDHVTVMPLDGDGTCPACLAGNGHICQQLSFLGIDAPGALQQYWTVDAAHLVTLPAELPLHHAALVEPTAVAVHDVRRGEVAAGDRVVVIGCGPIGLLIAVVARHLGADVVMLEIDALRRGWAADAGFQVLDPAADDAAARVDQWSHGAGADVVFEVSGAAAAVVSAIELARVRGTVVMVAIHAQPRPVDLQRVIWRELRIVGARVYQRPDFETAVELVADGVVPSAQLISAITPLPDTAEAFATLQQGRAMKILIDVNGSARPDDIP
jgi:(R,R)-butanediol dehydrogenase / meso-butanediol dehydrogenase / diacetyl reductase